ncbi:MAG: LacI family DNA-binding transcriptional regulator [Pseudomonadota bacterium]|nr:LacI family DNA-binding transcriptional regulator [Pseudomonadota bacterium]
MSASSPPPSARLAARPSRATGRVTLADVARQAGVSPITASRALRGERGVAPELVARVVAARDALGYVPDPAARALASRTSTHVGVLVPMLTNLLFVDLLDAAQQTLRESGYQTLVGVTHYDPVQEEGLLREQLAHRPAGLLLTGLAQSAGARALLAASGVPYVHMMELAPPARARASAFCVGFSQQEAASALTRHLLAGGRRRIAFVAVQLDARTLQRREGWRQALAEAGVSSAGLSFEDARPSSMALGAEWLERIAGQHPGVDAIFFCNDDLAQGALLAARRLDIAVPKRLAVAGFNDLAGGDQFWPPLTTVRTPRRAIGETAATMLVQAMRGQPPEPACVDLGFELVIRESA